MRKFRFLISAAIFLVTLPLVCIAEEKSIAPLSNNKMQELTQFLSDHKQDIKEEPESEDGAYKMFSNILEDQTMPAMLQAYQFIVSCSPEAFSGEEINEKEMAKFYLATVKHSNPVVRLYGLFVLNRIREDVKNPREDDLPEDIAMGKAAIKLVEAEYSPSTQDQELLGQFKKCFSYLEPYLDPREESGGNIHIDTAELISNFEIADPAVQFFLTYLTSLRYALSESEQLKQVLSQLGDRGDIYVKGLVVIYVDIDNEKNRISQLLAQTVSLDELATLGTFLDSHNVPVPLEAWPAKEKLEALYNKASSSIRQRTLELIKTSLELNES